MDKAVIIHQNLVCVHSVIANDLATALQEKIGCRVLIFNLCDLVNGTLKRSNYGRETGKLNPVIVANAGWVVSAPESPYPTFEHLFRIVYAVHAWLNLSSTNKALLACPNGRTRACLVAAAFLKYTSSVPCCLNGVMQFYKSVRPPIHLTEEDIRSKPLLKSFLESVDTLVDTKRYPYPTSHSISTIVIEGLLVEEPPEIEVWSAGECTFNSEISARLNCYWDYDDATAVYDINTVVQGDIAVVVKLKRSQDEMVHETNSASNSNTVVFRYLANTGLIGAGLIEIQKSNISVAHREDEEFFDEDFKLSICFHREPSIDFQLPEIIQCGTDAVTRRGISEIISWRSSRADLVLVEMVANKFQRMVLPEGIDFALLLANNNTAEAIKLMCQYRLELLYCEARVSSRTSETHKINRWLNYNWPIQRDNKTLQKLHGKDDERVLAELPLYESSKLVLSTDISHAQHLGSVPNEAVRKNVDKNELVHEKSPKKFDGINYSDTAANGSAAISSQIQTLSAHDGLANLGTSPSKSSRIEPQRVSANVAAPTSLGLHSGPEVASGNLVQKHYSLRHDNESSTDLAEGPQPYYKIDSNLNNTSRSIKTSDLLPYPHSIDSSDPETKFDVHRKQSFEVEKSIMNHEVCLSASSASSDISINQPLSIVGTSVATNKMKSTSSSPKFIQGISACNSESNIGTGIEIGYDDHNENDTQSICSRRMVSIGEVGTSSDVECQWNGADDIKSAAIDANGRGLMSTKGEERDRIMQPKGHRGEEHRGYNRLIDGTDNVGDQNRAAIGRSDVCGHTVGNLGDIGNRAEMQPSIPEYKESGSLQTQSGQKILEDCNVSKGETNNANIQITSAVTADDKKIELAAPSDKDDDEPAIAIQDDPRFSKYLKMLKMHVPKGAVAAKMTAEGLDPAVLDMDPELPAPSDKDADKDDDEPAIAIKDDPRFSKYLKMLKMHVPKGAVAAKMTAEGLDPAVLDMDPELPAPNNRKQKSKAAAEVKDKFRRKRLHWRSIHQSRLKADTIWSTLQEDEASSKVVIDDGEFEDLFIEKVEKFAPKENEVKKTKPAETAKIQIVEGKRAMNGAIALARVRIGFSEIASALRNLKGAAFTADQLVTLSEFLPTDEETTALSNYLRGAGDISRLGVTDRFMIQMMGVSDSAERFRCLTTQKRFVTVRNELSGSIKVVQRACNDVKTSLRLKRLLAVVLKLGNKLNVGANQVKAFTLDSLLKLKDAKAFDKKTSVMQFLIRLVQSQEPDTLDFRNDLANVPDASQVSILTIQTDLKGLSSDIAAAQLIVNDDCGSLEFDFSKGDVPSDNQMEVITFPTFIHAAHIQMEVLRNELNCMQREYFDVLNYFGEDPELNSEDFFRSLNEFGASFEKSVLEVNEAARLEALRIRRLQAEEERRTKLDAKASAEQVGDDARTIIINKALGMRSMMRPDSSEESSDSSDDEGSFR